MDYYDTAFDLHCATRAIAVYATSMLPVVAELGFRVRLVRVSHAVENPELTVGFSASPPSFWIF